MISESIKLNAELEKEGVKSRVTIRPSIHQTRGPTLRPPAPCSVPLADHDPSDLAVSPLWLWPLLYYPAVWYEHHYPATPVPTASSQPNLPRASSLPIPLAYSAHPPPASADVVATPDTKRVSGLAWPTCLLTRQHKRAGKEEVVAGTRMIRCAFALRWRVGCFAGGDRMDGGSVEGSVLYE